MSSCENPKHGGHRIYVGGIMDGQVDHVIAAPDRSPSDYGASLGTLLRHGQRSWYVRDSIDGTTVYYRLVSVGADRPTDINDRAVALPGGPS